MLDGRLRPMSQAGIKRLVPGKIRGPGVFETMRLHRGRVLFIEKHLDRLYRGLKELKVKPSFQRASLQKQIGSVVEANRMRNAAVRICVWKQKGRTRTSIVCRPIGNIDKAKGVKACISSRLREPSKTSQLKSVDYGLFQQAWTDAVKKGFDEAILLNKKGELVEGSRTNLFFVARGTLRTPSLKCGCLNGITRRIVMQRARALGIKVMTVRACLPALINAEEAFLTNAVHGIIPLTRLDTKRIANGRPGPLTKDLMRSYRMLVSDYLRQSNNP